MLFQRETGKKEIPLPLGKHISSILHQFGMIAGRLPIILSMAQPSLETYLRHGGSGAQTDFIQIEVIFTAGSAGDRGSREGLGPSLMVKRSEK